MYSCPAKALQKTLAHLQSETESVGRQNQYEQLKRADLARVNLHRREIVNIDIGGKKREKPGLPNNRRSYKEV